jgi:Flp pilus assembly pilin Flp
MRIIKIKLRSLKGMSLIEYAMLVAVVGLAILGMSIYVRRAVEGKWKQSIDIFGYGRQYDPASTSK